MNQVERAPLCQNADPKWFLVRIHCFANVRKVERSAANLTHATEVLAGDFRRFRRTIRGERHAVIDGILDRVLSNNPPQPVNLVNQWAVASTVQHAWHSIGKEPFQAVAVIFAAEFPIKERHGYARLNKTTRDV